MFGMDAALILADDNTAAKLIQRPGEAIYNDAGGLIEISLFKWPGFHPRSITESFRTLPHVTRTWRVNSHPK